MLYFYAILFITVTGLLFTFAPEVMWEIQHYFTVKNGEPTNFAIWCNRIAGILLLIGDVVCLYYLLTQ